MDFFPDMISLARKQFPRLTIQLGDSENLRYADESFDAVACAFGILDFPRPGKALAEAQRVLRPGAPRIYRVVRAANEQFFGTISEIILKYADPAVGLPTGPSQYRLSDPMVCAALMDAARFVDVKIEEIPISSR